MGLGDCANKKIGQSQRPRQAILAHTGFGQQIDCTLLEDTGAHTILHVLAGAIFDDDRFDAFEMQEMGEQQARGTCANDAVRTIRARLPRGRQAVSMRAVATLFAATAGEEYR